MFEPLQFEKLNEADVREEILAPLINALGYRSGDINGVIREQSLRYPQIFLGRKDPRKDPLLRGKADYILEAGERVRWVLEAKAPDREILIDDIEQAWSYANHPEVRAVYFVLSNGRTFHVYQTRNGPNVAPIFILKYEELSTNLSRVKNLLGPEAILRDNPSIIPDTGEPLGTGLRSVARITGGFIKYESNSVGLAALNELQVAISEGAVERNETGKMVAFLKTLSPIRSFQELNDRLGLSSFEMVSESGVLSVDRQLPTRFSYDNTIIFPKGERLLNLLTWENVVLPFNLSCHVQAEAMGILIGHKYSGRFSTEIRYVEQPLVVKVIGVFELTIV